MMNFDILKTELALPAYTALSDQAAADLLNDATITRVKASMPGEEIRNATNLTEYGALTDAKKSQWIAFTAQASINPEVGGINQQIVIDIFGSGSTTVTNLGVMRQETLSRATELGLPFITAPYVTHARTL